MPSSAEPSSLWVRAFVAVIVVAAALSLVAVTVIVSVDRDSPPVEEAAARRPESSSGNLERVEGAGPASTGDEAVDTTLDEIAAFVEEERGLAFREPVTVEVLDDGPFEDRLLSTVDEDAEQLRTDAQALQALGFVGDVAEVEEGMRALLAAGVLGYYDPETDELVVRGSGLGPLTRRTIAHELVHALDDQWFDLDRPEYDDRDDEIGFGLTALAEGNARRIDTAYAAQLSREDKRELERDEAALPSPDLASVPPVLVDLIGAPYSLGEVLVGELLDRGDQSLLDESFRSPPTTSEQVIDPAVLFAGEAAVPVEPPPADGPETDRGMFGELMLRLLLQQHLGGRRVRVAADGWGGDRYVVWPSGSGYCTRIDFAMDTPGDVEELAEALGDAADELPDARVERPQPELVRFTSCG